MKLRQIIDKVFARSALRFLQRTHRMTHRISPRLARIEKQRVLVIAPHPDDETIGPGGCLALHKRAGSLVTTLFVTTSGEVAKDVPRAREADRAATLLGYQNHFLSIPDGSVSLHEATLASQIALFIRAFTPDTIFCPFPGDHHRDHQATAASTALAISATGFEGDIWCYEVWSTLWPNVLVDISSVVEEKRAAMNCYESQVSYTPYASAAIGLNQYRGLKGGVPFAEGFYVCSSPDFIDACAALSKVGL